MQQKFMNQMADTVLKDQSMKDKREDLQLLNYYNQQQQHYFEELEREKLRDKELKSKMRQYLD